MTRWGGLGPTRHVWSAPVASVVREMRAEFPSARPNTYICHPWCGWGKWSVDWWGIGGRGHPLGRDLGEQIIDYARSMMGAPYIRHHIFLHQLWTAYGGYSYWRPDDHSGRLQHVHITYWP